MPTYLPVYARSPLFISESGTAGQDVKCEIYLYNDPSSVPSTPTHTLTKPIPSSLITTVHFDVSPYFREYINHLTHTEVTADTAGTVTEYCRAEIKVYLDAVLQTTYYRIGFDGYGYFEDDYNPAVGTMTGHMTDGTYYVRDNGSCGGVYYNDSQAVTWEAKWTGLTTGGTTTITLANEYGYVPYVHPSYVGEGNKLEIIRNTATVSTYYFEEICEDLYTPVVCDFVNRYGAWQQLIFFKARHKELKGREEKYKLMPSSIDYDITENIQKTFNKNAMESITCNTGWVPEGYSEVMKELLLSETIRLDSEPVNLTTKNIKLHTHLNDKTINYEMKFDYANDVLNYII